MEKFIEFHWKEFLLALCEERHFLIGLSAFILLLVIYIAYKKHTALIKIFDTNVGFVRISRRALMSMLRSTCSSSGVTKSKLCVAVKRGKLFVTVKFQLESGQNLSDVALKIQEQISSTLRKSLGIDNIGRIDVIMSGFKDYSRNVDVSNCGEVKEPKPIVSTEEDPENLYDYTKSQK